MHRYMEPPSTVCGRGSIGTVLWEENRQVVAKSSNQTRLHCPTPILETVRRMRSIWTDDKRESWHKRQYSLIARRRPVRTCKKTNIQKLFHTVNMIILTKYSLNNQREF